MVQYGKPAVRQPKKKRGQYVPSISALTRYRPGRGRIATVRNGKLVSTTPVIFPELEKVKGARPEFTRRRAMKPIMRKLFRRPIEFHTSDGKQIIIFSSGIFNVVEYNPRQPARAMVAVLVNGERIFFYRSSGQNSLQPGAWFPTWGMKYYQHGSHVSIYRIRKVKGHSVLTFPDWIAEVAQRIEKEVATNRIRLEHYKELDDVSRFEDAVNTFPPLERHVSGQPKPKIPD